MIGQRTGSDFFQFGDRQHCVQRSQQLFHNTVFCGKVLQKILHMPISMRSPAELIEIESDTEQFC
jgi:hypothetical protein